MLVLNPIAKYGIDESDIYNFDEVDFMMGVIYPGMVVKSPERRSNTKLAQHDSRKWVTVISWACVEGWAIPPFIIVSGQYHLSSWYEDSSLPQN